MDRQYQNSIPLDYNRFYKNKKYNNIRRLKLIIISDVMGKYDFYKNKEYNDKLDILEKIETSCLNEALRKANDENIHRIWTNVDFVNLYHTICYKVLTNLDVNSDVNSMSLPNMIKNNEIDLRYIANMTSKELCPEKYILINEKIEKRNNLKRKLKYSELYFCKKCKHNQCTIEKRYNRSLDEGVNLTINCLFCGNSWNS